MRLDNWELSHVLELPETYSEICRTLCSALGDVNDHHRAELLVRERAVAIRVFTLFEQTCYYRDSARKDGDRERLAFLEEVLAYFTNRLLLNPRLRYLWAKGGGNLQIYFEPETVSFYTSCISTGGPNGDEVQGTSLAIDSTGPYGTAKVRS